MKTIKISKENLPSYGGTILDSCGQERKVLAVVNEMYAISDVLDKVYDGFSCWRDVYTMVKNEWELVVHESDCDCYDCEIERRKNQDDYNDYRNNELNSLK